LALNPFSHNSNPILECNLYYAFHTPKILRVRNC
jgi:hypothetical protein